MLRYLGRTTGDWCLSTPCGAPPQWTKTSPGIAIGERRAPRPNGRPGYLRIDSVHPGAPLTPTPAAENPATGTYPGS